ncbi:MAG: ABC transporter ATP-binding protein [Negativibacillus massiliensis]|jgi:ABC-2 type transport system ATP-binding protein|uniref:ABC transporter ATP-binding protein n=1 Tax=Negativibacillus massiliensis TaxID=1871035 RepID=UPI002A803B43|nr:ABC transporter ATP-binding protein [Negativibacillus massiliensis]MDY4048462.1 ABC transporter ATP-binding protein [Negativibacillus massiliensis]
MNQNTELMQGGSIMELPVLEIKNVHKKYLSHSVLEGVGFSIPRGKIVGLLGPNGCGKTTILKLISGLLQLDEGEIRINGICPGQQTKSMISYLPERSYLNDWMKISDILNLFSDFYADFDRERAEQMLTDLKISKEEKLKTMSKGTKEKVQLILVMSRRASLYLLDEPIGGVDPATREYILHTILKNFDENSSILITTHLIQDVETIFDQVLFLNQGKIVIDGEVDEIREKYGKSIDGLFREVFRC